MTAKNKKPTNKQLTDEVIRLRGLLQQAGEQINKDRAEAESVVKGLIGRIQAQENKDRVWEAAMHYWATGTGTSDDSMDYILQAEAFVITWNKRQQELKEKAEEISRRAKEAADKAAEQENTTVEKTEATPA